MPIVSRAELHKFMSEPEWSPGQQDAADMTLAGVESSLEDHLYGAPISPREPMFEVAPVSPRGIVMTSYPVFSVGMIGDVVVDEDHPLAAPYTIRGGYVRVVPTASTSYPLYPTYPSYSPGASSAVSLTYRPGWGSIDGLRIAILRKAKNIMQDAHDDTMVARGTDATRLPALPPVEWTESEIKSVGTYRNLFVVM